MASECTTDSAGTRGSASPFPREIEVIRHAPLWPPRKVVNMGHRSAEPGGVQGQRSLSLVIPGCALLGAGPESITTIVSMDSGPAPTAHPGMTAVGAVNSREKADYLRISLRPPYIHLRLATAPPHRQDSVTFTHAPYAPIPRPS